MRKPTDLQALAPGWKRLHPRLRSPAFVPDVDASASLPCPATAPPRCEWMGWALGSELITAAGGKRHTSVQSVGSGPSCDGATLPREINVFSVYIGCAAVVGQPATPLPSIRRTSLGGFGAPILQASSCGCVDRVGLAAARYPSRTTTLVGLSGASPAGVGPIVDEPGWLGSGITSTRLLFHLFGVSLHSVRARSSLTPPSMLDLAALLCAPYAILHKSPTQPTGRAKQGVSD